MKTIAIIPARMGSTRYPDKPLEKIHGMPMIGHVYYRTGLVNNIDQVCVATCDQEIVDYIEAIGGLAIMTADTHERASDRSAEALVKVEEMQGIRFDNVAMIQGDEPMLQPEKIQHAIHLLSSDRSLSIVNLMGAITSEKSFRDYNEVKVVCDLSGNALYFSREPIPSAWHGLEGLPMRKQLGLIFFQRNYLIKFNEMEPTALEIIESVDMMRVLEHGDKIRMVEIDGESIGVDTPEELQVVERLMLDDPIMQQYLSE
jgi:3-deoxy-manno-octulosonate cytidylyltransferase (CMP-KDO synthetase)